MNRRRVVVTGMGVVTPLGNTVEGAWHNIREGVLGIQPLTRVDTDAVGIYVAGEVRDFDPSAILDRKQMRRTDRIHQFAYYAAYQALQSSKLEITEDNAFDIGCMIGTSVGGVQTMTTAVEQFAHHESHNVNPFTIPNTLGDSISARVSQYLGIKGVVTNIGSACATGNSAVGFAGDLIRAGRANVILAGGAETSIVPWVISGFRQMGALNDTHDPLRASLPFHRDRVGFIIGEGAGVLILEDLDHAIARHAPIFAELKGYGQTADAYHMTAPDPIGHSASQAMTLALQDAELQPQDINYINAHGTGTPLNDPIETRAIKQALGDVAYKIPISASKSMTGHTLSASSALESVWSIMSICDNYVPPTIGLDEVDPECDLNYTPLQGHQHEIRHVMNNSFGFGGLNAVTIFGQFTG